MSGSTPTNNDRRGALHTHELIDMSGVRLGSPLHDLVLKLSVSRYGEGAIPSSIMDYERICNHDDAYMCECRLQYIINFIKENYEK